MLKIYITDLAAYNKGFLIGEWVGLPCADIEAAIDKVLRLGEATCCQRLGYFEVHEEYFITDDWWGEVELFRVGEYDSVYDLNSKAMMIEHLDTEELKKIRFLLNTGFISDLEKAIASIDDVVVYGNSTMEDVAFELIDSCYDIKSIPSIIANNIDYKSIARDMEIDGRYFEIDGDIYEYCG